jgi:hypothetical protein
MGSIKDVLTRGMMDRFSEAGFIAATYEDLMSHLLSSPELVGISLNDVDFKAMSYKWGSGADLSRSEETIRVVAGCLDSLTSNMVLCDHKRLPDIKPLYYSLFNLGAALILYSPAMDWQRLVATRAFAKQWDYLVSKRVFVGLLFLKGRYAESQFETWLLRTPLAFIEPDFEEVCWAIMAVVSMRMVSPAVLRRPNVV